MSPLGLPASALICAKSSPVAFCVTVTLTPVTLSKPIAMPWHHAVEGELQYMASVPCDHAAVAQVKAARPAAMRNIIPSSLFGRSTDLAVPAFEQTLPLGRRAVLGEVVIDELDVRRSRRQR